MGMSWTVSGVLCPAICIHLRTSPYRSTGTDKSVSAAFFRSSSLSSSGRNR